MKNIFTLTPNTKIKIKIPPKSISLVSVDSADLALTLDSIIYKGSYNEMYFYYEDEDENEKYILVNSENEEKLLLQ
jgi:ABC-type Fe3+/spermidine/putrescine transport system ATPase subunit